MSQDGCELNCCQCLLSDSPQRDSVAPRVNYNVDNSCGCRALADLTLVVVGTDQEGWLVKVKHTTFPNPVDE